MNCANHPDVPVSQYCRTCGKPLCASCVRNVEGVAYCEQCLAQHLHAQGVQPTPVQPAANFAYPPSGSSSSGPNPALAGILAGFFPFGVGAVYTGQYAKGLAHLITMTLLIWGETVSNSDGLSTVLGLGIAFFYVYQIIDAVKSAHAIRAGLPAPDPFGLGAMFGATDTRAFPNMPVPADVAAAPGAVPVTTAATAPRIPTAAVVLIGLGCLFLLRTAGVFDYDADRIWPLALIALGGWMFARRFGVVGPRVDRYGRVCRTPSLVGPSVLVTIGVLILLDHMNGLGFHRTWPIILLAIGAAKLLENKTPVTTEVPYVPPQTPPSSGTPSGTGSSEVNRG
jgi:Domain of unknown function (DUF5668)/B-box zinc finger